MFKNIKESLAISKLTSVFSSNYYPIIIFLIVLFSHCFALDMLGFFTTVILLCLSIIFCDDLRPAVPVIFMFPYVVSTQNSPGYGYSDYYARKWVIVSLVCLFVLIVVSFITRLILYKEYKLLFKNKKLLIGFIALSLGFLLAGTFSGKVNFHNLYFTLTSCFLLFIIYIIFATAIKSNKDNVLYLSRVAVLSLVLMCLEIVFVYILRYETDIPFDFHWKGEIVVGSVVSNSAGEFIAMMLPFCFYLAYKEQRGYVYYIISAISIFVVFLTLSRTALIIAILLFLIGTLFLCFKSKNKLFYIALFCTYLITILAVLIIFYRQNKFEVIFKFLINKGLSISDRLVIWQQHYNYFKLSPIFGVGFSYHMQLNSDRITHVYLGLAHNTIVQIISSAGIVGILSYIYHRFETIKLTLKKPSINKFVIGVSLLAYLVASLADLIFFAPNFMVVYTLLLVFLEKEDEYKVDYE